MQRRQFLSRAAQLAGLALVPGVSAMASASSSQASPLVENYQRFHGALAQHPELALFAGVTGDLAGDARIEGRMPKDLNGVFFRNGPGRFDLGGERYHHWFDGDGFAQRWQIADGKVSHIGKFVQTEKIKAENQAGKFLYPTFGSQIERAAVKNSDSMNAANTNLLPLNGSLYALWEGGSALELDPLTLATRGVKSWRADLKAMPFSAHPKVEPNGDLWNFGALPGADQMALYRLNSKGELAQFGMLKIPQLAMVHDFAVSAAHLIFLVAPFDVVRREHSSFLDMHHWAGSGPQARGLRAIVISKADLSVRQIFELPPSMVFHLGNAYDDGDTTRLDAALIDDGKVMQNISRTMRGEARKVRPARSYMAQITLDYRRKQARQERLFGASDFPRVMPQVVAARHRKLALLSQQQRALGDETFDSGFDGVAVVDTDSGKADRYQFGADWQVEEHIMVPRQHAKSETDGYLVGVLQNRRKPQTVLSVFDAAQVAAGPIALAHLDYRAPICFHGNFL